MIRKVLWTGGWDSTYRVLDLILNKKVSVKPYYIIDERRRSTKMELKTMKLVKEMVKKVDNNAALRILETEIIHRNVIPKNKKLTESYRSLVKESHLGDQYDWLARYTYFLGINDLELCVHKDDTVEGFINKDVELIEIQNDKYYKLNKKPSKPELIIFSNYHFPLFDMTKLDMEKKAKDKGFNHIMEVTWFCHSPIKNKPCGMCNPCKYTKEEGLERRVPKVTILRKLYRTASNKWRGLKRRLKNIV